MNLRHLLAPLVALLLLSAACSDDAPVYSGDGNNGVSANNNPANNATGGNNAVNNSPANNSAANSAVNNSAVNNNPTNNAVNNTPTNNPTNNNPVPQVNVGAPCASNAECGLQGLCIAQLPGGYCSQLCTPGQPTSCPDGDVCLQTDGAALCVQGCDDDTACRDGYACATWLDDPFCAPVECRTNAECDAGRVCAQGTCYDPTAAVGDPCDDNAACPPGGFCVTETNAEGDPSGFSGGYCTLPGCTTDADCGPQAACIYGDDGSFCLATCDDQDPCRTGYACIIPFGLSLDTPVCYPGDCVTDAECPGRDASCVNALCGDQDADLGDACRDNVDCASGAFCITPDNPDTRGFIGGYCAAWGCDPLSSGSCGEDGVCIAVDDQGLGLCLEACEEDDDCRDGGLYTCRLAYPELPPEATACLPILCTQDSECPNAFRCQDQACVRR